MSPGLCTHTKTNESTLANGACCWMMALARYAPANGNSTCLRPTFANCFV